MTHWHQFIATRGELSPDALHLARQAWEARREVDADLVKNHCPSHRNIGDLMAKEITETD